MHFVKKTDSYLTQIPEVGSGSWISVKSTLIGAVKIGKNCSVWPNAVIRGDINSIVLGDQTNVQENAVLHVSEEYSLAVGSGVTIGHNAVVHGCTIEDGCLIGMGAIILDGVVVGKNCLIGAGSLLTMGTNVPEGSLVLGAPGKVVRKLTGKDLDYIYQSAESYVQLAKLYRDKCIQ